MSEFDDLLKKRAVALKYDPEKNGAPVVVASGMGYMAEKITEAAMEAGVPIYEDDSLATLLGQIKLGAAIPTELYQAIVEIYIYFLAMCLRRKRKERCRRMGRNHRTWGMGAVVLLAFILAAPVRVMGATKPINRSASRSAQRWSRGRGFLKLR